MHAHALTRYCHPWADGVTYWLTHSHAGITPLAPGYSRYAALPHVSSRNPTVSATHATPYGPISVDAHRDVVRGRVVVHVSAGTSGESSTGSCTPICTPDHCHSPPSPAVTTTAHIHHCPPPPHTTAIPRHPIPHDTYNDDHHHVTVLHTTSYLSRRVIAFYNHGRRPYIARPAHPLSKRHVSLTPPPPPPPPPPPLPLPLPDRHPSNVMSVLHSAHVRGRWASAGGRLDGLQTRPFDLSSRRQTCEPLDELTARRAWDCALDSRCAARLC
jgi:hypothetical protein